MKTIEEKARAYDEAIKKAAALYKASEPMSGCNVITETLFPELKESKDERIRKALIEYFKHVRYNGLDLKTTNIDEVLSWLEKQEGCEYIKKDWLEHIKQSWYKEGLIDGKYSGGTSKEWTINDAATLKELIDFLENGTAKLQHDLTRYANWLKNQFTPVERQGEQKPADSYCQENCKGFQETGKCFADGDCKANWSEEDDKVRTTIINEFEQCSEWCCANGLTKEDCIDWLQSLKDRVQPQPKQGWRADEEAVLDALIRRLKGEDIHVSPHLAVECLESLKGRVQPKQEWNEEDERNIQGVIDEIEANKNQAPDYDLATYDRFLSWLKSLKGRVQPKVELTQLDKNILEATIAFVEQNNHFNYWGGVDKQTVLSALRSLRPQK